jgi:TfoX/Sxy family transcriptional regulator of competence genes
MASRPEYVEFVCCQLSGAGKVTYRKMFGDYCIYCNAKVLGLICDDIVYIKPTNAGEMLLKDAPRQSPYEGAKPHLVLEELDDKEFLTKFVEATCAELPLPKPKKKISKVDKKL